MSTPQISVDVPGLPTLAWVNGPGRARSDAERGSVTLESEAGVDWTNDAAGGEQQHAARALALAVPDGDFVFSARVHVPGVRTTFDAGALALWSDQDHWAKLCNEYSPQGAAMVVSVVTDRFSDDCNGPLLSAPAVFLRVARSGPSIAFHSSDDGSQWDFVRTFRLPVTPSPWSVGFLAQSPLGEGCTAVFDTIRYDGATLHDLRDGS
ncbi:DUF1349 domain-containing protein [Curtobacterium sp. 9128]|uniref:DUF1349 domain-containing protein n=1 Tax=Curtobacterium sp. 9128 TaxID=1793722 RepID=UPI0011A2D458|nr:DUF1349 domain-containing protein [Curtobacterium sp. 9128]